MPSLSISRLFSWTARWSRYTPRMSTIVTRNVADIPEASRQHVEQLLGCTLRPDQRVSIIVDALYSAARSKPHQQRFR